jgi:hypothetical protein
MKLRQDLTETLKSRAFFADTWIEQDFDPSFVKWFDANIETILAERGYAHRLLNALVYAVEPGDKLKDLTIDRFLYLPNVGNKTMAKLLAIIGNPPKAPQTTARQVRFEKYAAAYVAGWESYSGL